MVADPIEVEEKMETEETADDAKSDIEEHEMIEVDKNGDSSAPAPAPEILEGETDDEKKNRACRQIEFYFSDSNLPYDRFMWTLHTANAEHWVPIKTVGSFKRMREFSSLGNDWLVSALRPSLELEVEESGTNVRRRTEVKEPKGQFERSIYAKGFGSEYPGLQEELEKYFDAFGRVNAVRMRRKYDTKEFKGSVFVEYADVSSAERFLSLDPKPKWKDTELLTMSKDAYCDMKVKEKGLKGKAAEWRRSNETNIPARNFNAFRQDKRGDKKRDGKGEKAQKPEVFLDFMGKKLKVIDEDGGRVEESEIPYVKNSAFKLTGIEGNLTFDEVKAPMKERFEHAPFIKYEKGASEGLVGFSKALTDEDIAFIKEKIKTINGKEITWLPAEEAEEKSFLVERAQNAARRVMTIATRQSSKGGRGGARGGRGGARGGDRKGRRGERPSGDKPTEGNGETQAGEKRKRAVEPDGGPDAGTRGVGVPVIQSSKKTKTEDAPPVAPAPAAATAS
ncbi:uncharacterized protein FOMMEDRAFT_120041 [Fomitiporia mediterranea MF3/22]|uniref:uncharacterized protein n=1 Tax=Fomitiporia mediterranea (strain MF3/22) TaxID=694068 RepID=UPI000440841B|nr:uncharacterized protein FOMMEDRAFT_120041 [Fomitiporia mediterranea MF3/22]EJD04821.1 hypothetical protein FOMMEDRAFT_120041 [Fomitiporia mediterranea MF3/22]